MPKVRLLADAAGRYDARKGELFVCTDEEFSRWEPAGVVELATAPEVPVEELFVEVEEPVVVEAEEPVAEEPVPVVKKARSTRKSG